jgi:hypothetical protein
MLFPLVMQSEIENAAGPPPFREIVSTTCTFVYSFSCQRIEVIAV